jgi:hypothetical protein
VATVVIRVVTGMTAAIREAATGASATAILVTAAAVISTTVVAIAIVVVVVDVAVAAETKVHKETIVSKSTRWTPTSP